MSFQELVQAAPKYFPNLIIQYKDQSSFMKTLGTILFFNKNFMTSFASTIGSTVYFPNETFIRLRPISSAIVLLHELVHMSDEQKYNKLLFGLLYLFPQVLILLFFPLLFVSWKIALFFLLFAAPIPAYFRMYFEKRAYISSLYCLNSLGNRLKFDPKLDLHGQDFLKYFKDSSYYFVWPFRNLDKEFSDSLIKIKAGQRPFEDPIFDTLDKLIITI